MTKHIVLACLMPVLASCGGGSNDSSGSEISKYLVTVEHSSGGKVSPTSIQVPSGSTATFEITPDTGYTIASASGCGGDLSVMSYTTATITQPCKISVEFEELRYSTRIALSDDVLALTNTSLATNVDAQTAQLERVDNSLSLSLKASDLSQGFDNALVITLEGLLDDGRPMQYALLLTPDELALLQDENAALNWRLDEFSTVYAAYALSYTETTNPDRNAIAQFRQVFNPETLIRRGQLLHLYKTGLRADSFPETTSIFDLLSTNAAYRETFSHAIQDLSTQVQHIAEQAEQSFLETLSGHPSVEFPYGEYFEFTNDAVGNLTQLYANYSASSLTATFGPVAEAELPYLFEDGEILVEQSATRRLMSTPFNFCQFRTTELTTDQSFIDIAYDYLSLPCERSVVAIKPVLQMDDSVVVLVTAQNYVPAKEFHFFEYGNFTTDPVTLSRRSLHILTPMETSSVLTGAHFTPDDDNLLVLPVVDYALPIANSKGSDLVHLTPESENSGSYTTHASDMGLEIAPLEEGEATGTWYLNDNATELKLAMDEQPRVTLSIRNGSLHGFNHVLVNDVALDGYFGYRFLSYGGSLKQPMQPELMVGLEAQAEPKMLTTALAPRFDTDMSRFYEAVYAYPIRFMANNTGAFGFNGTTCGVAALFSAFPHEHLPKDCAPQLNNDIRFTWDFALDNVRRFKLDRNGEAFDCARSICDVTMYRLLDLNAEGVALVYVELKTYKEEMRNGTEQRVSYPYKHRWITRMRMMPALTTK